MLLVGSISFGQQMPFSSHYYINMMTVNPALTGSGENTQAYLSHRSQFTGLNGGPQTSYLSFDGPTLSKKFGIGFTALNDVTSILARTNFMVNYAYSLKLGNESNLRFGLAAGIQTTVSILIKHKLLIKTMLYFMVLVKIKRFSMLTLV